MIKGLIFDLDGTLLYSVEDLGDSVNEVLKEYGYPIRTYEEIKKNTGNGFRKLVERSLPEEKSEEFVDEAVERFKYHYDKLHINKSKPYDGILELLKTLNRNGIKIAINTNKGQKYSTNIMNKIFAGIDFVDNIGKRDGIPHKPDPTAINIITEEMGLTKDEVAYVGDSEVDVATGKNAGVKTIACAWGFRTIDVLENAKPTVIVHKPEEILDYLEETK